MGNETKVGLLVGMSFIICVAIVLSHRGKLETPPPPETFEIASVLSDAPVPPVLPEPREQLTPPRRHRAERNTEEATPRRSNPASNPRIGENPPGLPPAVETQFASADEGDIVPRVAEALTRFTRRAGSLPASAAAIDEEQHGPIVASLSASGSDEPLRLTTPASNHSSSQEETRSTHPLPRIQQEPVQQVSVAAKIETPAAPQRTYVIQPGDTLGAIAQKHYGTCRGGVIDAICKANTEAVPNPNCVVAGRTIVLPELATQHPQQPVETPALPVVPQATEVRVAAAPAVTREEVSEPVRTYTVKPGDTLTYIAREQYGSSSPELLEAIVDANRDWMPDADHVVVGKTVRLPAWGKSQATDLTEARVAAVAQPEVRDVRPAAQPNEPRKSYGREGIDWVWYQLKKGDVYSTVAASKLGTAKRWRELAEMNADIFPDPGRIRSGVNIRVPLTRGLTATQHGDA